MSSPTVHSHRPLVAAGCAAALAAGALGLWSSVPAHADTLPSPDHVVVVVMENHAYGQILGSSDAPYLNSLASGGATLTQSYGITHPSQPNYYALFSGDTQGVTDDSCVDTGFTSAPNLASELLNSGQSWGSYNEGLPSQGSTTCSRGDYAQKHAPWFGFNNVPTNTEHTFNQFPSDFSQLPKVSFVVPDLCDDMHDCSVGTGDSWVKDNLDSYAQWAKSHNSLLVVTYDEDDLNSGNQIPTLLYGQHVAPGSSSSSSYNHYDMLHTLEDLAGLNTHAGASGGASDITGIWN
ncbi:hypothetical protein P3T36_001024 [Kitasatospora sp. MAP12-15]|uniref:alkaline phosphatase family protein n=1 Tax=unclassified Kitasatospora TaxID=2633591 RepID=UPI0024764A0E|nr:alkaline phosphatase family protein [Kitasatospora sp. MAP12-44]MDH6114672.1 hypothetical protein [Kitasatospora sp. MAP12-44]